MKVLLKKKSPRSPASLGEDSDIREFRFILYSIKFVKGGKSGNVAFKLAKLSLDDRIFSPQIVGSLSDGLSQELYADLWRDFEKDFVNLPTDSYIGFAESLFYLLKEYTWCIPSNTMDMSDVSLFEHLKTTGAFADCLYRYYADHKDEFIYSGNRFSLRDNSYPVILLGGDISGIQKFIYNITSKKAAVSLKGRSFYLQLLIESLIQRIVSDPVIDCTIGQVVYSSGGKFYMLLPNTGPIVERLRNLRTELENQLWREQSGQLAVNMEYVPFAFDLSTKSFSYGGEKGYAIGDLWKELADRLNVRKNARCREMLVDGFDDLFVPQAIDSKSKICAVTGIESGECVSIDEGIKVLPSVKKQIELGIALKDADYIITYRGESEYRLLSSKARCDVSILGVHHYLFDKRDLILEDSDFRVITSADVSRINRINEPDFTGIFLKGRFASYGFSFYGGNVQARTLGGDNKTFEQLADGTYLGVLRMDVDNLGSIFIEGLQDKSFAAYSTLSFMLDIFFSGYLNAIRSRGEFKDDVDILYAGGDDVFAVGKWDKLISFAESIRKDFQKFVGRNDITISGGMAIVSGSFPISKAAQIAGEAEDSAKHFPGKNAFSFLGETVSWEEYEEVKDWKKQFVILCEKERMPKSILHQLMTYAEEKKKGKSHYMWHSAYYLTRFAADKSAPVREMCSDLKTKLYSDSRHFELAVLAARWAELEIKN